MLRSAGLCAIVALCWGLTASAAPRHAPPVESSASRAATPPASAIDASDVLGMAVATIARAGNVKAEATLEAWYPFHYTSSLAILAAQNGDERVEATTTMNEDTTRAVEVISGGVLWTESASATGPLVTKVDINAVKKALAAKNQACPALPLLGANALMDLASLAKVITFRGAYEEAIGERKVYVLLGTLKDELTRDNPLPYAAQRFYKTVSVWVDQKDFFPRRIELGREGNHPLLRLEFTKVELDASLPKGAFSYAVPEGVTVVDRTDWTVAELEKGG